MKNIAKLTSYGCYLDCDFATAKYPGDETHIVGNVAEYVYDLEQKLSDLEAKLAEKEDQINWLVEAEFNREWAKKYVEMRRKEDPMLCLPDSDEVYERYFELKQQIAEKDEDIEELKDYINYNVPKLIAANKLMSEQLDEKDKQIAELEEHDKIYHNQLAIEQFEKLKEFVNTSNKIFTEYYGAMERNILIKQIDNQIKQLKEMPNEK